MSWFSKMYYHFNLFFTWKKKVIQKNKTLRSRFFFKKMFFFKILFFITLYFALKFLSSCYFILYTLSILMHICENNKMWFILKLNSTRVELELIKMSPPIFIVPSEGPWSSWREQWDQSRGKRTEIFYNASAEGKLKKKSYYWIP